MPNCVTYKRCQTSKYFNNPSITLCICLYLSQYRMPVSLVSLFIFKMIEHFWANPLNQHSNICTHSHSHRHLHTSNIFATLTPDIAKPQSLCKPLCLSGHCMYWTIESNEKQNSLITPSEGTVTINQSHENAPTNGIYMHQFRQFYIIDHPTYSCVRPVFVCSRFLYIYIYP